MLLYCFNLLTLTGLKSIGVRCGLAILDGKEPLPVRLFARVDPYVLFEITFQIKRFVAVVTNVTGFGLDCMVDSDNMQLQITTLSVLVAAQFTGVWFLAGMRSIVFLQQIFEREAFSTDVAFKSMLFTIHYGYKRYEFVQENR